MRESVIEFQNLQQQLQMVLLQKQQMQMQLSENSKVQEELGKYAGNTYRFAGSVLVQKDSEHLKKELNAETEAIDMRKQILEKQESKLIERLKSLEGTLSKLQSQMSGSSGEAGAPMGERSSALSGPSITKKSKAS